ncbi:TMEM175 family protein [Microbacterium chocolatum]|uniref:TMEM175 family protein n=1 Tax=Microbacterium aurantiacum TaxID=162393 RepID=UPI00338E2BF4
MAKNPDDPSIMSTARTEAYSDAVFAIAATLLVLDLTTATIGRVTTDAELWAALGAMMPNFIAFGVSFALLSMLWVIHARQFRDIARVDEPLLWLNNARLLFIVLIPFTTSLTAEYSEYYAGRMLFPINFFFAALMGFLSWEWASRGGRLLREGIADARAQGVGGRAAVMIAAVVAVISPWVGSWAFFLYFLNGPLTALLSRRTRGPRDVVGGAG